MEKLRQCRVDSITSVKTAKGILTDDILCDLSSGYWELDLLLGLSRLAFDLYTTAILRKNRMNFLKFNLYYVFLQLTFPIIPFFFLVERHGQILYGYLFTKGFLYFGW